MADDASILNDPPHILDGLNLLHDLIDFTKHNDACAIDFTSVGKRVQYSYGDVQSCVTSLASQIEKLLSTSRNLADQSCPQHVVPILFPQSPGLYISQLAILLSGGAFCPITLDAPKDRLKFVVRDVSANLIITTSEFKDKVSWENGPTVIVVDQFPVIPNEQHLTKTSFRQASSLELAYVMYTSGSSGTPKGVAVSHFAVSQSLLAHEKLLPPFRRFLQFAAPSFDVSVFEIFFPLSRGSTLVGCDRSQLLDNLPGMINELDVDVAELTPTVAGSLLRKRSNTPKLSLLLTIGEMLTRPLVEEFGGSDTQDSILYGMYGPTEAAIHCTVHPKMKTSAKPGNIGVPFDTVSAFIAAPSSTCGEARSIELLPNGEVGELVLGGPQLAQGYLNRQEQNNAAFILREDKRYYRTGDKAKFLEDGTIEILGRMSAGQVKLRGQRIELGEIEEAVYRHPGMKSVVAIVLNAALVLFALTDDQALLPEQVAETCAKWLPEFMVPKEIVILKSLPYLPSGKVDKRKLEADFQSRLDEDEDEISVSATPIDYILQHTLLDLLGPFPRKTRLAATGLDSLMAIRVASKLRASGINITTLEVLQADTLADLKTLCESAQPATEKAKNTKSITSHENVNGSLNGNAKDVEYTMACTPLQSAMLSETAVNGRAYMNCVELELQDIEDLNQVSSALKSLAEHNPIIRTGFAESKNADGFVQIVWKELSSSQIETVEQCNERFDPSKDLLLHHPLHIQVRNVGSNTSLLIHLHHALYDAWSLELLFDDLESLLIGQSLPFRPSFSSIVEAQQFGTTNDPDSRDYWKDHLSDLDMRQVPNFYNSKVAIPALAIAKLEMDISTTDVEMAAKSLSSSPQSIFQAAYALILSSYLGTTDVCFGTVFSGRTQPIEGIEDVVGPCLATLPIRIDVAASLTVRDFVHEIHSTNRKHLGHSATPLRKIKTASGVQPPQTLFDTVLIWQQTLHNYDHVRKHVLLVDSTDNLEFNLTLEVIPRTGNVELKANYQQSLFPHSQADLLLKQIEQLVRAMIRDQTLPIGDLFGHLTDDVLSIENENPQTTLKPGSLSSPVEKVAYEDPGRPAIHFATSIDDSSMESQVITYSQLNASGNRIGHHLLALGILPDELVCICMEKSVHLYASILATAKIGAGYLPVTPDIPFERMKSVLREGKVKVILAQSHSRPLLDLFHDIEIVYVDKINIAKISSENISPRFLPGNISYCVFTSGSTGTPKGVLVTQGNLLSNLDVLEDLYPSSTAARVLQSCSQAFDVSVFEIFFTWRIGGCLCSAVKDVLFRDLENAIRIMEVTHLSLTPTVASLIDPCNVPGVHFLVTAGEAVTQKVFNTWAGKGLYQGYGPSETTNICTVNAKVSLHDSINNIGPPFRNTSAFVLAPGPGFTLVPRGGEGEFCFGGSQIFRGYLDHNQNTGKMIIHPRFGRLYRSGDFGRLIPGGSLAFTGRKDDQVKIRGQRVELGEITNVMLRSREVCDCVAMVMSGTTEESQRLVCFWTPRSKMSDRIECLQVDPSILASVYETLEAALPFYMIPSALIPISLLPSTSQGKIDKGLLTRMYKDLDIKYLDSTAQASNSPLNHEWTDTERGIATALAQQTKMSVQDLSPDSSFFNLGIDSISAIPLSRMLSNTLKCQVDISEILKYPSIARLGERISGRGNVDQLTKSEKESDFAFGKEFLISTTEEFQKAGKVVVGIMPCTALQEAMLSAAQAQTENLYSNTIVLDVSGNLEKLKACWQEVTRRHEILRTCFVETGNARHVFAQVVLETFETRFELLGTRNDASHLTSAWNMFDPPYSLGVVQSNGSTQLVISMHHAMYDAIALETLFDEVEQLYQDQTLPPAVSFAPYLKYMLSMKVGESDQFWQGIMKACLPTRIKRVDSRTPNHALIHRKYATRSLSWIHQRTQKYSTSLLAVCHTVWAALISERFQETDVCFGNVVSGRTVPVEGIERLVAPCFNTIPIRLQDVHQLTYLEAFRKLQSQNAHALPFQLTPLRQIQSKFSPDGLRLFDTLFILQQPSIDLNASIWSISEDIGAMDFPLICEVATKQNEDAIEIILHSHSSFITPDHSTAIIDTFSAKLQAALETPRQMLLLSTVQEQIIVKSMNRKRYTTGSKVSRQSKTMTTEQLKVREVVASFTDVPIEKITQDVSIFRLGLDSISAVQVAARLRKQGHIVVAGDILEHPTIAQLCDFLAHGIGTSRQAEKTYDFAAFDHAYREAICLKMSMTPEDVQAIRPCTAVQQGMVAQTLHSEDKQYFNSIWFELLPDTSILQLKAAWTTVCREHEMLRSGFVQTDDPRNPFALVTYAEQTFSSSPWFAEDKDVPKTSTADQLARRPWKLTFGDNDNRKTVKFTAHHALYDAQSIQLILSDIGKAYYFIPLAPHSLINPLLGSILLHERDNIEDKKLFWQLYENRVVVNHFPDLTPLRVLGPKMAVREIFSQLRTSHLEELCKQRGVTIQAAGQAAWAKLLTAYTGECSTTFGITLSGRSVHENAESIPFPTIVTLPVRCDVTGTNEKLLSRTMRANALLHKYQFTPLTSIQKWAGFPEGNMFDTVFAYQKLPDIQDVTQPPWKVVREEANVDFAVSLEIQPTVTGDFALRLTFRENLVPIKHAELLLKQYDALLLDLLRSPGRPCDLTPELGADLLSITPAKDPVLPGSVSLLHEFVERGAVEYEEKNALEFATCLGQEKFQSHVWTYEQVDQESNKIAQLLCKRGILPGQLIAICFEKCAEASFAIIGILKAGCAYVALDPNAPWERMSYIMDDSDINLILTAGNASQNFKSMEREIVNLDSHNILRDYSSDPPILRRAVSPKDTCYCLYTSGTTGTPKGCLITHENAVQAMYSFQRLFSHHCTKSSKWLQFASFHFDVSVLEQFWSWSVGICVVSAPRDLIFEDISGAIRRLGITHIDLTPSLARLIHPADVPALCKGVFITGGEQLRQEILDVWGEHGCIYNGYGPTEATIGCTMYPRVPANGKASNIGPQFDNVGSYVLKPNTTLPVLRGGIGELCVSGKLVGKGYLNRPDLTTERFPTLQPYNERVYRTGDLVRILHDGSFLFLGRADDQVKLRGQRVELSEINQVIKRSVKDVEEAVTLVLRHRGQKKEQLVTFFVPSSWEAEFHRGLLAVMKRACQARLPGYMVPIHFIPINAVPLNANNKADAKELAAMYDGVNVEDLQKLSHSSPEKLWKDSEKKILDTVAQVLETDLSSLTKEVTIFELGLDSISMIAFSHALRTAGLSNAKLSVIKTNPTMESLVDALMNGPNTNQDMENAYLAASQEIIAFSQRHMVSICQTIGVESTEIESIAPCTPIQQGMIYRFLESHIAFYFNPFEFCLKNGVNTDRLRAAWEKVVARLEILRTKFIATDDGHAQVVMKRLNYFKDTRVDYDAVEKSVALENPHSFTITSTSIETVLCLRIFHGLYDANSLNMLLQRVVGEYQGLEDIDYGPSFQSSLKYGPLVKMPRAEEFWRAHLHDWTYQIMPTTPASESNVVTSRVIEMDGFESLRRSLGVTHQALIQAAWLSVLQQMLSPVLTLGIVISGRSIDFEGAERVIAPLFNILPYHAKLDSGMTASSLILRCHNLNMQIQDFQHTPLKDIQRWSPMRPGQSLFDSLFVFLRPEVDDENFAKGVWTQGEEIQTSDYSLAFEATLSPGCSDLRVTITSQSSKVAESKAVDLLDQFGHVLKTTLKDAGRNVISNHSAPLAIKKNRHALTVPASVVEQNMSGNRSSRKSFVWTKEAAQIRQELASLANVDEAEINEISSIFELGLDSIDVIKLSSRLGKRGIAIPVSILVKSQTIERMSCKITVKGKPSTQISSVTIIQDISRDLTLYLVKNGKLSIDVEAVLPATPLQQSMVNEMIKSDYKRYFAIEAFEIGEHVDVSTLLQAVENTIKLSPILRTSIIEVDDPHTSVSYAQLIHKSHIGLIKVAKVPSLEAYIDQFKIDLVALASSDQPLCQTKCVFAEKKHYLIMAISHALYDGTSLRALHEDIKKAYEGILSPRPDPLPFIGSIFLSTTDDAKRFWRGALYNLPFATFPRKELSDGLNLHGVHRMTRRSLYASKEVESFCRSLRITLQTLGQTCWAMVLSHLMTQLDVVFGCVLACRDSEEAEEVMFPLMNTVAVRAVLHGTISEMLEYMQDLSDNIRQYQQFPLGTAQAYALASKESGSSTKSTTLFDTLFIHQGRRHAEETKPLYKSVYGSSDVEFPVCVEMEIVDDEVVWTIACKAAARTATETEDIVEMIDKVLEYMIRSPQNPVIASDTVGVSVCGLPKFSESDTIHGKVPNHPIMANDDRWSDLELKIKIALHELSDVPLEAIRKDTTIFHIGLDSILILKLPVLLRRDGIKLEVSTILKDQTIRAMAQSVTRADRTKQKSLDVDEILSEALSSLDISTIIEKLENEVGKAQHIMPITAGQEYMIRSFQISQGTLSYPTFEYPISWPIDKLRMNKAWWKLLKHNDILRTGFIEVGLNCFQVVFEDPQNEPEWQPNGAQPDWASSLDLRIPPISLTVTESKLKLKVHHALYDGISLPLLIDQLQSLYQGQPLPIQGLNFKTFVAQSVATLKRPESHSLDLDKPLTRSKWEAYLMPGSVRPFHTATSSATTCNKRTEVFRPLLQISPLKSIAQESGVSVDALLLAGIAKIYAQRLDQDITSQVVFGIYHANRAPFSDDLSQLAIPTLNLLPLCVRDPLTRRLPIIARDIQTDLQEIGSAEMSCASLNDIWKWCGVRVDFFVNILKDTNSLGGRHGSKEDFILGSTNTPLQSAKVVEVNHEATFMLDERHDAYLPSVDIELKYRETLLDMGVFAPTTMISVNEAEEMITHLIGMWT